MNVLKHCVDLNTQAIVHMQEGRFVESSLMLNGALEKLEGCSLPSSTPIHSYAPFKPSTTSTSVRTSLAHAMHPKSPVAVARSTVAGSTVRYMQEPIVGSCSYTSVSVESPWTKDFVRKASPDNIFSFYPRMFHITHKGHIDPMELMKITMIVMFNEALSRHAIALMYLSQYKANPEFHLTRVLGLYQRIVVLARSCFQYNDVHEMLCVLVAATNNYGHIASQLLLFNEMRDSITNVIQLLGISNEKSFLHDDVRLFFESVCIFLEGRNLRNAPAA